MTNDTTCSVCGGKLHFLFVKKVLWKHDVRYFECKTCGFVCTEKPYWLKEAYSNAIADADTGLLLRNIRLSKVTSNLIYFLFNKKRKHIDYAGGYGVFTRLMRDIGFDYYWDDPKSDNIFAKNFDVKEKSDFQVVTAFEFFEHIVNPKKELKNIFEKYNCEAVLISTTLYRAPINKNWWYFANKIGQHISFYQRQTLDYIAKELGLYLNTNGVNMHMFSRQPVPKVKFRLLTRFWFIFFPWVSHRMKSRTFEDHLRIIDKK